MAAPYIWSGPVVVVSPVNSGRAFSCPHPWCSGRGPLPTAPDRPRTRPRTAPGPAHGPPGGGAHRQAGPVVGRGNGVGRRLRALPLDRQTWVGIALVCVADVLVGASFGAITVSGGLPA